MHHAILEMRECSQGFVICSPEYAYGPLGIPPRIPKNSTIIFDIRIVRVDSDFGRNFVKMNIHQREVVPVGYILRNVQRISTESKLQNADRVHCGKSLESGALSKFELSILILKKTLSSHPADKTTVSLELFVNIQRFVLTAKQIPSANINNIIRHCEEALALFDQFGEDRRRGDIVKIVNKLRYNLADLYTKNIMSDFDKAEDVIQQFHEMERSEEYSSLITPDVKESFVKLENVIMV